MCRRAVQIQLMDMVYRKALRLGSGEVAARGVGGVVNLQTNDVNKLERFPVSMHGIWEGPLQVLVGFCHRLMTQTPVLSRHSCFARTYSSMTVSSRLVPMSHVLLVFAHSKERASTVKHPTVVIGEARLCS